MSTYLRYPHVHESLLTVVAADDIWLAPIDGGRAWRLTNDRSPARTPRFSPDGQHIAFVSYRDGHPEVYVVSVANGGSSQRLTWWGAKVTRVLGWTGDGRVLAATHAGEFNIRHLVVKAVGLDGSVERLSYGPASGIALGEGGTVLATPGSRPPAQWKRYRGGTAPKLWIDKDGSWQQLLADDPASLVDPMWVDGKLVFVSDRAAQIPGPSELANEQANLWVFDDLDGEPRQLTFQRADLGYVRDATSDGRRIVWHSRGQVFSMENLDAEPHRIDVVVPGGEPKRRSAEPGKHLGRLMPDDGADGSVLTWRGNAYWLTHREGPARALLADSGVRAREPVVLGKTGYAAFVTDAEGVDAIEIHHLTGEEPARRICVGTLGRILHLASDPSGERLAAISHDGVISLVDVAGDGDATQIGRSVQQEALSPGFSPDGRYAIWSQVLHAYVRQLMIYDTMNGEGPFELTSGTFHDHDPAFSKDGKYVVFLSNRTFDPEYDVHEFGLFFGGTTRPWLIPISAEDPAPFGPSVDGWRISKTGDQPEEHDSEEDGTAEKPEVPPSPDLDIEGAEDRAVALPVPSGNYRRLQVCSAGILWIERKAETGQLGTRRAGVVGEAAPDVLQLWSWEKRTAETIVDKVSDYAVSGDGRQLVVRFKEAVNVVPADRKAEDKDPAKVEVDLSRLRFDVDPRAEWMQMYHETVRLMRDHFWREDMDGVDWDAVEEWYRPVVETLATHDDLVDLLWEVNGELNTSHAYVLPSEPLGDKKRMLGLLGADLSPADEGWRIERILPGESSDPFARSPLRSAGVDAREGDLVVSVDGVDVDPLLGPNASLIGAANKPVELTLRRDGSDRRVVVVPLDDEEALRYQDWVRSRREYVEEHGGGRLGYVHIPDMASPGWAQLHRDLRHALQREGLIVDVRYNRGGHTSQLVLSRLSRQLVGWIVGRHNTQPDSYPASSPRGPVVLLANEYSGSDGDTINAASQAVGLGPVIGVRTWGGVVGIDGRFALVDGTAVTQPRYAFWLEGKDWGVENHGVDPDIEVVHTPADYFSERDPQLDRGIAEALSMLEAEPARTPPDLPVPKVGG